MDDEGPRVVLTIARQDDEERAKQKLQTLLQTHIEFNGESAKLTIVGAWQVEEICTYVHANVLTDVRHT